MLARREVSDPFQNMCAWRINLRMLTLVVYHWMPCPPALPVKCTDSRFLCAVFAPLWWWCRPRNWRRPSTWWTIHLYAQDKHIRTFVILEHMSILHLPVRPVNSVSVIAATSTGAASKYVQSRRPIEVISSPKIGISMHGFRRRCLFTNLNIIQNIQCY